MMNTFSDLAWVTDVDPERVYDVLARLAGAPESRRRSFVDCWGKHDWTELSLGNDLGCVIKLRRGETGGPHYEIVPNLYISCLHEKGDTDLSGIINEINRELTNTLISAGVRKSPELQVV